MSLSELQANQAKIFIFSYRDALKTLEQASRDLKMKENYEGFLGDVIDWQNQRKHLNEDLMRKITMFQYSHYYFLKKFKTLPKPDIIQYSDFISILSSACVQ